MPSKNDYDIVIAGGGLVGLSLAAVLGKAGFQVAVLEARQADFDWPEGSIDLRVYALSRASQALFVDAGAWPAMQAGAAPYREMRVWDAGGNGDIHFDSAELGEPCLGHILESRVIEKALLEVLADLPGVSLFCPASVKAFENQGDRQQVELQDGRLFGTTLLVGADGKDSRVRGYAGIHARASDYGQQGLVAVVATQYPHADTAWQRFLPSGPLAFLPLRDGRCSIVWSADTQKARRLMELDDAAFCAALGEAFAYRLGHVLDCGERALFPLRRQHAERYVAPRLALVGDASHVVHPLAGQGVNLGLKDVRELVDTLLQARGKQRDIGSLGVLRRYERARKGDTLATLLAMDGFKHLFGSRVAPLRWARNLGLNLVDAAPPLKNQIMRAAMGM